MSAPVLAFTNKKATKKESAKPSPLVTKVQRLELLSAHATGMVEWLVDELRIPRIVITRSTPS